MKGNSLAQSPRDILLGSSQISHFYLIRLKTIVNDIQCEIVGPLYSPDTPNRRYLPKIVHTPHCPRHLSSPTHSRIIITSTLPLLSLSPEFHT